VEFYNQRGDPSIFPDSKQRISNVTRRVAPMYLRLSGEDLQLLPDSKLLANVVSHTGFSSLLPVLPSPTSSLTFHMKAWADAHRTLQEPAQAS
jgi:hypothetical protein